MANKLVSFGEREIKAFNYSRYVSLPKMLLRNLDLDAGDRLEFILDERGACFLKPHKVAIMETESLQRPPTDGAGQPTAT